MRWTETRLLEPLFVLPSSRIPFVGFVRFVVALPGQPAHRHGQEDCTRRSGGAEKDEPRGLPSSSRLRVSQSVRKQSWKPEDRPRRAEEHEEGRHPMVVLLRVLLPFVVNRSCPRLCRPRTHSDGLAIASTGGLAPNGTHFGVSGDGVSVFSFFCFGAILVMNLVDLGRRG